MDFKTIPYFNTEDSPEKQSQTVYRSKEKCLELITKVTVAPTGKLKVLQNYVKVVSEPILDSYVSILLDIFVADTFKEEVCEAISPFVCFESIKELGMCVSSFESENGKLHCLRWLSKGNKIPREDVSKLTQFTYSKQALAESIVLKNRQEVEEYAVKVKIPETVGYIEFPKEEQESLFLLQKLREETNQKAKLKLIKAFLTEDERIVREEDVAKILYEMMGGVYKMAVCTMLSNKVRFTQGIHLKDCLESFFDEDEKVEALRHLAKYHSIPSNQLSTALSAFCRLESRMEASSLLNITQY